MGKLTFPIEGLKLLLADAEKRWPEGTRSSYGEEDNPKPGFWLVGDNGVYLMHNGPYHEGRVIVYAKECNPETMDFDAWWDSKRNTFGGDDGVVTIEADTIKNAIKAESDLTASFKPDNVELSWMAKP